MGSVWMAEQEKPVRRRVALKLVRADLGSKEILARFEAERQALAMMDHQNIAKVLDAGTTEGGIPYFVMELVKGIPITQFCDDNKLSIDERLELFVPVCKAIQHAHQKGIIHRDLKPSTVLVTLYDGEAVPKVIDFGLAKAIEHTMKLTDKTMFTEFGKVVGTLQYMSPEQAETSALDVDTRTDIYSLGVMLYELLTGSTPLEKEALGRNALLQVLEIIREKEPPRPSIRLGSSVDAATGISEQRKIAPAKLQQILRGELDWVVMKALEKDRSRRYETANSFADDIQRYLDDEAVTARPPSTGYRIGKLLKRHRVFFATAATILVLIVGAGWFFVQFRLARIEADHQRTAASAEKAAKDEAVRAAESERIAKNNAEDARKEAERLAGLEKKAKERAQRLAVSEAALKEQALALVKSEQKAREEAKRLAALEMNAREQFRRLVNRHPRGADFNTLAVLEFRMDSYDEAIKAASMSVKFLPEELNLPGPYPDDLAILAISYRKLGNAEQANDYRHQLNEAMKMDAFKNDNECQSYLAEVDEFFKDTGTVDNEGSD
jgi:hypothetical protein